MRLAWRKHGDSVERVAVTVDVPAKEWRAAQVTGDAGHVRAIRSGAAIGPPASGVNVEQALVAGDCAAAVRLHILVARVDRQHEVVGESEFGIATDVSGIR